MPLMQKGRRGLALALIVALAIPALSLPLMPAAQRSAAENRMLARAPAAPRTFSQWRTAPRAVDAFIADHFGFREDLIKRGAKLLKQLGGRTSRPLVAEGRNGRLFLNEGLLRSTGWETQPARAADFAAFICEADRRLNARGVPMTFAVAPSPAAIYPEDAPSWAVPAKGPTEYDLILADVRACGVTPVDLRPALRAAKASGQVYWRTDSHWTPRGALAAFDVLVAAMGRPDWRIDPATADWRAVPLKGDLPRLSDVPAQDELIETTPLMSPPAGYQIVPITGVAAAPENPPTMIETGRPGPTVLVIGDSYAQRYIAYYMARFTGRVAWVHHQKCAFDWRVVDVVKPDQVLILPVDRFADCDSGTRPRNW
jgi:hypothetical protein